MILTLAAQVLIFLSLCAKVRTKQVSRSPPTHQGVESPDSTHGLPQFV